MSEIEPVFMVNAEKKRNKKRAVAIRHVAFEDLGSFQRVLEELGYSITYREAGIDDLGAVDVLEAELLVILGGPIAAYQEAIYPFLSDELHLLEKRLTVGQPTIGICLGAQLMARALGSRVSAGPVRELGWKGVTITEAGGRSPVRHLRPELTPVLHWHGDTFDLPAGAELLASSDAVANQAFCWGASGLALQFHPEVTAAGLERWYIGHALEISQVLDGEVSLLRTQSTRFAPTLEVHAEAMLREWLSTA